MISIIVAIDNKNGFAKNKEIPWYYKEDFQYFRKLTTGHICLMGKNTYQEINAIIGDKGIDSVLPNRDCYVLSSTLDNITNAMVVHSFGDFITTTSELATDQQIFIIGGKTVYDAGLKLADRVYVTHINKDFDCDTFFDVKYLYDHFPFSAIVKPANTPELEFKVYSKSKNQPILAN